MQVIVVDDDAARGARLAHALEFVGYVARSLRLQALLKLKGEDVPHVVVAAVADHSRVRDLRRGSGKRPAIVALMTDTPAGDVDAILPTPIDVSRLARVIDPLVRRLDGE